jgi:hypothetical protein
LRIFYKNYPNVCKTSKFSRAFPSFTHIFAKTFKGNKYFCKQISETNSFEQICQNRIFTKLVPLFHVLLACFAFIVITTIFREISKISCHQNIFKNWSLCYASFVLYLMDCQHLLISAKILAKNVAKILAKTFVIFSEQFCKQFLQKCENDFC